MSNRRRFGSMVPGAGLKAFSAMRAAAYAPGKGLDIIQINLPGDASLWDARRSRSFTDAVAAELVP